MCLKDFIRMVRVGLLHKYSVFAQPLETDALGRLLLLAPHPDDEVIGCGGLLARLVRMGVDVRVVVLSDGAESHHGCCDTPKGDVVEARHRLTREAAKVIGLPQENIYSLGFPDGGISKEHPEVEKLRELIAEIKPDTVLVPHGGEGWSDHLATREIGLMLAPNGASVWEYCVWFWYYNSWNIAWRKAAVVKLTPEEHAVKLKAIDAYTLPTAPCGKPWSGVLPKVFLDANKADVEVYFKVR